MEKKNENIKNMNHLAVCKVVLFMFKNKKWTVDKKLFTYFFQNKQLALQLKVY